MGLISAFPWRRVALEIAKKPDMGFWVDPTGPISEALGSYLRLIDLCITRLE